MTLSAFQIRLVAGFAALNVLLGVGGWLTLVSPQRSDAASVAAKVQSAETQLATLTGSTGSSKQPVIHTADIYSLDTALPAQVDLPNLLFQLDRLATASGVTVLGISPQAAAGFTVYTVQPIILSLSGTYFQVTGFLHSLRMLVGERQGHVVANGPLFSVASVTLNPGPSAHTELATVGIGAWYYGVTAGAIQPVDTSTTNTTTTTGG